MNLTFVQESKTNHRIRKYQEVNKYRGYLWQGDKSKNF